LTNQAAIRTALTDVPEYTFGSPGERNDYQLFPDEMERDPEVFFHGTDRCFLQSIVDGGFRLPPPDKAQSASFARTSALALGYASGLGTDGVVIAVRFDADNRSARDEQAFGLHVYRFDPQPKIISYCIVPAAYVHR
jgi:hypothetical protein